MFEIVRFLVGLGVVSVEWCLVRFLVEFLVGLGVVGCIRSWRTGRFWCG